MDVVGVDQWLHVINESLFPFAVVEAHERFRASIRTTRLLRGVTVTEAITDGHELSRTKPLIKQAPTDGVLFVMQLRGGAEVVHAGHRIHLEPGAAVLCDPLVEYRYRADPSHQLVVMLPRQIVLHLATPLSSTRLRPISPSTASLRALTAVCREASSIDDTCTFGETDAISGAITDLARSVLMQLTDSSAAPQSRTALVNAALTFIREKAVNPATTPETVAASLGISVRQLAAALKGIGTPAHLIRCERLRQARNMLIDPMFEKLTVSEVGCRCGFTDPTTFTRAFRREFGDTPSSLRRPYLD